MGNGLGAAYTKQWRERNPTLVMAYRKSTNGKYAQLKRAAKRANRTLELTQADFNSLIAPDICFYCKGSLSTFGYSIDRLDHHLGYTKSNSVPCCGVRRGKRDLSCNFRKGHLECVGFEYPRTVELLLELLHKE